MSDNIRELCLDILVKVLGENVRLDTALHECMNKKPGLKREERAFLSMLSTGTVERCIELDHIINNYSNKPVNKQKPVIRAILRMSVYQIKYMDSVPDSAAVNEAVKLAIKKGYKGLKGFVNGILRNIARNIEDITYPDKKDIVKYLSVRYSVPEWIVSHFLSEMPYEDTEKTFEYFLDNKDVVIRFVRNEKIHRDEYEKSGIKCESGHIFDKALRLKNPGRIDMLSGYDNGDFVVQDESSMIPGHIASSYIKYKKDIYKKKPAKVLDMCAAPGGKTMHVASEAGSLVKVDACDISEYKTGKIAVNAVRLKLDNVNVAVNDALCFDGSKEGLYDVVIADLPCSGLGVIATKPDIKYNIKENTLAELADIQKNMLDNAAKYVRPGGILIYSTCTTDRMENEQNAAFFSDKYPEYSVVSAEKICGDDFPEKLKKSLTKEGYIRVVPGVTGSDGFFVAVFLKDVNVAERGRQNGD